MAISKPQLVVVAQGQRPAPPHIGFAEVVEETHEVGGLAIGHGCKQMGREGEVEGGMQLSLSQIGHGLIHRLNRLGEQQHFRFASALAVLLYPLAQPSQKSMGFHQAFTACSFPLKQKRNRIEAKAIDPALQPKLHHLEHGLLHLGVVVVEVGLMVQEAVQIKLASLWIPLPVGALEVPEEHWRTAVALGAVAPHIKLPLRATWRGESCPLEPWVKLAGVIEHQV